MFKKNIFLFLYFVFSPTLFSAPSVETQTFLDRHWQRPLASQGFVIEKNPVLTHSLLPEKCGRCHVQQFKDWSGSLHSKAMSPGLIGQLMEMAATDRESQQACLRCHAPLKEQAESLVASLRTGKNKGLHTQGLICAGCHLREGRWFGPPRKDGSIPTPDEKKQLPHSGWNSQAAFEDSAFCAACHQFDQETGFAINGKLLENTYQEWLASPFAEQQKSCQSCHMPNRRHLWKGIHDAEMTRNGITIEIRQPNLRGDNISAQFYLKNSGTGHNFPTYITPKIYLQGVQLDAKGSEIAATFLQYPIGWKLELDLSGEQYDTRLAPDEELKIDYAQARDPNAVSLLLKVVVEPDAFYSRFYRSLLENGYAKKGKQQIEQALRESEASVYILFERRLALP
ncbi:MAG: multiheme c-type cytochrome [Gammaproteobacteria bacterium]|nr:multiheme c-type cytochrome [Gammaproteobacteria bacterium]